jgi:hypothetical protein
VELLSENPGREGGPARTRGYGGAAVLWAGVALGLLTAGLAAPAPVSPQDGPLEYRVKAAFLLNFARFAEWPEEALPEGDAPIYVCVYGSDPFRGALDELIKGESVGGHPLEVRRLRPGGDLSACHVVFIGASERARLPQVLGRVRGQPVLTVGEMDGFLENGGIIRFVLEQRRVRFDVNLEAAEQAGVRLRSQPLKVARRVEGAPGVD